MIENGSKGTLERGLDILSLLGSGKALEAEEIAATLAMPKSSVYRLLKVMAERGLVFRAPGERAFRLGLVVLHWADKLRHGLGVVALAKPALTRLAERTGETVSLTLLDDGRAVTADVVQGPAPVRVAPDRGRTLPLYCGAASKAILAFLPEHRWPDGELMSIGPRGTTDWKVLRADLMAIRERGYALSVEEVYEGAAAAAVPLFSTDGPPIGSLAVSGPAYRMVEDRLQEVVPSLRTEADRLGAALGGRRRPAA